MSDSKEKASGLRPKVVRLRRNGFSLRKTSVILTQTVVKPNGVILTQNCVKPNGVILTKNFVKPNAVILSRTLLEKKLSELDEGAVD